MGRFSSAKPQRVQALYLLLWTSPREGLFSANGGELVNLPIKAFDDELMFERWKIQVGDCLT